VNKKYDLQRKIISFSFNFIPGILFGVKLYDAGSTKLYKKKVLQDTKPSSQGVFGEAERIILANRLGYKVTSVPVRHFSRKGGVATGARFNLIHEAFIDMIKFGLKLH